jgi:hypothetical protein
VSIFIALQLGNEKFNKKLPQVENSPLIGGAVRGILPYLDAP